MTFGAIFLLALGVAMDATAVAAARGFATPRILPRHVVLVAVFFGGFQSLMPMVGWFVGKRVGSLVQTWDHWIAFVLLMAIGCKMLWEARGIKVERTDQELFGIPTMLVLALATSIDALAVGITLPLIGAPFLLSIATIGATTAVLSALGLFAGRRFGAMLGKRLDVAGGLVLIGLGTKILVDHLRV